MLIFGFLGEAGLMNYWVGFIIGMAGWLYIIYEISAGEASQISAAQGTEASKTAFNALRLIVTIGWAIYPIGYIVEPSMGAGALNVVYNLADFVNKIAFGVVIWVAATSSSKSTA